MSNPHTAASPDFSQDRTASNRPDASSDKMMNSCFSDPPSPAFSLDSNSPFANGFLHFESSLFGEDEDSDEGVPDDDEDDEDYGERRGPASSLATRPGRVGRSQETGMGFLNSKSDPDPEVCERSDGRFPLGRAVLKGLGAQDSDPDWGSDCESFPLRTSPSGPALASVYIYI